MVTSNHPLRRWRAARRMTLNQLKELVGVTQSHLSEIERGNNTPSLELATKLSAATGGEVKVEEFVRRRQ